MKCLLALGITLAMFCRADGACASVFDQVPSIAYAKGLATAIDAYLEMPSAADAAPVVDRARMAQGLAESISRLGSLQFNDMTQKLISDYLSAPAHRRDLESFVELVGASSEKEQKGKVSHVGISAAEDALFFVTVLAALHGTPYAFRKLLGPDGLVAGWVDPITRHRALGPLSRLLAREWRQGRTWGGTITYLPRMLWNLFVVSPNEMWLKALARPIDHGKHFLYPLAAATGVGHTLWQTYHDRHLDPRQALKIAQLRVLAGYETRLSDLDVQSGRLKVPESELGFEESPSELPAMEADAKCFAESASEDVRGAAQRILAKIAELSQDGLQSAGL